jgi:SAM-dependent methyltransferase
MNQATCCSADSCNFSGSYDVGLHPAVRRMEEHVLGTRYGATSWTTLGQAQKIASMLQLNSRSKLLDVGGGAGWPSLFLSKTSGCTITIVDLPENALGLARNRAIEDGLAENVNVVCADGTRLPFDDDSFDCIVHADVLCCLPAKLELLRECRRVATPAAKMHFSVILPAPTLPDAAHREAVEHGPPFVDVPGGYASLLANSGWNIETHSDASDEYQRCMNKLVDFMQQNDDEMGEAFGRDEFIRVLERRQKQQALIHKGWLQREVFVSV